MTWARAPIRRLARLGTGHTPSRSRPEYWENCTIPWLTLADVWQLRDGTRSEITETAEMISELGVLNSSAVVHPAGTVALSRTASVGFSCILGSPMATSQDFVTWTCGPRLLSRYLLWVLRGSSEAIRERRAGSTHQTIYMPDIETLRTPVPSLSVQQAIADHLDWETARIDALIAAKRRMIELARERLDLAIRESVLGDGHGAYPVVPLRRLWSVIDCKHRTPTYCPSGYPVVSPGDVVPGDLDLTRCTRFVGRSDFEDLTSGGRRPRRGDIIYSRNASIGIAAYVSTDAPFTMGQDVCLITSSSQNQRYLTYVLNTLGLDQLEENKIGSTFSRVNIAQIKNLLVPAPTPDVQANAVERLDLMSESNSRLVDALRAQIDLLVERRQALITAAVTGEIEVPGVAA